MAWRPRPWAAARVALLALLLAGLYVGWQATVTLDTLERVERERDTWQRPDAVLAALALKPGDRVADLGSGAGYFALRLAAAVGPAGQVYAIDVQRQPLAFLWIRAWRRGSRQISVQLGQADDPGLPPASVDAVLIVNTYHELTRPSATLAALGAAIHPGGRLVVTDRRPRRDSDTDTPATLRAEHRFRAEDASREVQHAGFRLLQRDDTFIDRPGDDPWWLLVFERQ